MPKKINKWLILKQGIPTYFHLRIIISWTFFSLAYIGFFFFWLLEWQICKYNFICDRNNGFHLHKGFLPPWIQTEMPLALIIASEKIL